MILSNVVFRDIIIDVVDIITVVVYVHTLYTAHQIKNMFIIKGLSFQFT